MSTVNPLFPSGDEPDEKSAGYLLPAKQEGQVAPVSNSDRSDGDAAAANLIREKLSKIYAEEPSATEEMAETAEAKPRSKHQQFMYELSRSGKSLAEVQTEWHNYYVGLTDKEKHEVWQEFYESNANSAYFAKQTEKKPSVPAPEPTVRDDGTVIGQPNELPEKDNRTTQAIKATIKRYFKYFMTEMVAQMVIPCVISFVVTCIYKWVCLIQISNLLH